MRHGVFCDFHCRTESELKNEFATFHTVTRFSGNCVFEFA